MDFTTKMPSIDASLNTLSASQTEKPHHYTYLKEFRTQQCPDFLQHKCTRHRPYTCFHWHFLNQKRRRPVKRRDGSFNYSADVYCSKYDETTGLCPDGDECGMLHHVAGDAERRYHLRYYKTCVCVHETDTRGQCSKNGQHCAFAHGNDDLRQPIFEAGEEDVNLSDVINNSGRQSSSIDQLSMSLEKDIICNEDPAWNDMHYVLAHYKTEICKRPHRLCRQGYACPSYHNLRDKRRSPLTHKYRSTPCPSVKHSDEWGDPSQCDSGEDCSYCHTRTEQQFHPEIYKSTKCNDMVQTGYCPRGPFCAFAHVEQEMNAQWDLPLHAETSLAAFVCNALPNQATTDSSSGGSTSKSDNGGNQGSADAKLQEGRAETAGIGIPTASSSDTGAMSGAGWIDPSSRACASSFSSDSGLMSYHKAPGCEREQVLTRRRASTMDAGVDIFAHSHSAALASRGLPPLMHSFSVGSPGSSPAVGQSSVVLSPRGAMGYSSEETVESVIGNALDEDFGRLYLSSLDTELLPDNLDGTDARSPLNASFSGSGTSRYFSSASVGSVTGASNNAIPSGFGQSPVSNFGMSLYLTAGSSGTELAAGFANSMPSQSSLDGGIEVQRLREELAMCNLKLVRWKDGIAQARNACEAWRKEAEDWSRKAKKAEEDKLLALRQRDEAGNMVVLLRQELDTARGSGSYLCGVQHVSELEYLSPARLQQLHAQLRRDLDRIEKVMSKNSQSLVTHCMVCNEQGANMFSAPCHHGAVCVSCATHQSLKCPVCWAVLGLPSLSTSSS